MLFTFLARVMVTLTDEDSPDTSDGGTIYKPNQEHFQRRGSRCELVATDEIKILLQRCRSSHAFF